jgi:glycosyltransferase involved in cell wall biosynthesis
MPHKSKPTVSVIIAYYNQPAYIAEAVASAMQPCCADVEVIVVDDCSPVSAESVLSAGTGLSILRMSVNGGVSAARNYGFEHSSGEFLIFLDQDDRLMPGAIDAHVEVLRSNPGAGLSFGAVMLIDRDGKTIREPHICRARKDYFLALLESNPVGASPGAAMIRRTVFEAAGGFDPVFSSKGEDYWLYLQIARSWMLARHATCVLAYRKHASNASHNQEKMLQGTLAVLDRIKPHLTRSEMRRFPHARRRWIHAMQPRSTLSYRLISMYYSFRAMLTVPLSSYFSG